MNLTSDKWTGFLSIDIENRAGKSVPKNIYYYSALKVQRPIYHGNNGMPCFYILNVGGGYMNGDTYRFEIRLREKAKLTLTTLGATLIYKTLDKPVYQESEMFLAKGSYLAYLPDLIIGYENAQYKQSDTIYMEQGATLIYAEILTPGWSSEGNSFSYNSLQLKTNIYMENELVVFDHIKLAPAAQPIKEFGFMGNYTHLGTLIVIGERTDEDLIKRLHEVIHEQPGDFEAGISRLSTPGFTIRILANLTQDIQRIIAVCHEVISEEWFNEKPMVLRKY